MGLILPEPRLEMPSLMRPGVMPRGPVVVDHDHPLSRGLVCALIFNQSGGDVIRDISGHGNHLVNLSTNGFAAAGYVFNGLERPNLLHTDGIPTHQDLAVVCRTSFGAWGNDGTVVRMENGNQDAWLLDVNNSVEIRFTRGGMNTLAVPVTGYELGKMYTVVGTSTSGDNRLYVDGALVDSNGDTTWNGPWTPTTVYVGNEDGTNDEHQGTMELLYIYDRPLSHEDGLSLSLHPYQMMIPE